ncbi:hypothetical protein B0T14DRAFT_525843 [Immersiella caudata]|uniref:Uncharacterized protein n=1 Tax=Immersiella caudata TaxID=314043 RepID=A0AA39TIU5_9PEZI|nr:hypothetical protein B0T14DRAFT_525843 [Immersiella caudata]
MVALQLESRYRLSFFSQPDSNFLSRITANLDSSMVVKVLTFVIWLATWYFASRYLSMVIAKEISSASSPSSFAVPATSAHRDALQAAAAVQASSAELIGLALIFLEAQWRVLGRMIGAPSTRECGC